MTLEERLETLEKEFAYLKGQLTHKSDMSGSKNASQGMDKKDTAFYFKGEVTIKSQ